MDAPGPATVTSTAVPSRFGATVALAALALCAQPRMAGAAANVQQPAAPPVPPPTAARGADCFDRGAAPGAGPLPAGTGPADFGAVPESCPDLDVSMRLRSTLLIASDAPDFFGLATAGATFRLRYPFSDRTWVSLAFDAVTYRFAANATVQSSGVSAGPPTVGVYRRLLARGQEASLAVYGRALLPLDTARQTGVAVGLEAGATGRVRLSPRTGGQGGLLLAAPAEVLSGQIHAQLVPGGLAELWLAPRPWVALFGGATARFRAAPDPTFTSLAARAAVRLLSQGGLSFAAAADIPFLGRDRTDLAASLFVGWQPR
jgi:hypothetical protein